MWENKQAAAEIFARSRSLCSRAEMAIATSRGLRLHLPETADVLRGASYAPAEAVTPEQRRSGDEAQKAHSQHGSKQNEMRVKRIERLSLEYHACKAFFESAQAAFSSRT